MEEANWYLSADSELVKVLSAKWRKGEVTIREMADKIGLNHGALWKILTGRTKKIKPQTVEKLKLLA